ncbi:penicillin-binding transpeptidase domain-containing protein [Lentibacillus saliphilus]|uniref:penicillin-binding transpeptidase domain-containing protein n=1 Tax=Lentibacillus saliphilus TaxID=2737028 RepID=UPI001C308DDF|nr:penicillin-binding transpeptidase domain-containing protein [Lentibacillus saliphilus]
MKQYIFFVIVALLVVLTACTKDDITPNERFATYTDLWESQEFTDMFKMVAQKQTDTYEPHESEAFIDRYEKIYDDLNVSDLEISYNTLDEEALKQAIEKGKAHYPFSVSMKTIAGPIQFEYDATLVLEGEEDDQNWFLQWNPGFIFPELKDGGDITLKTTKPERGDIVDRNRIPLALNDEVYEVGIVPGKFDNSDRTIQRLADLLTMDADSIKNTLNQDWVQPDYFVPMKKIMKTDTHIDDLLQIPGIQLDNTMGRVYPLDEAAAHLIGYIGQITAEELEKKENENYGMNDMIGKRGIEQLFENRLRGESGTKILITKETGDEILLAEKPVQDGEDIMLTIDASIQKRIFEAYDGDSGTASAINPKTGETLALVSSPAFNPNDMAAGLPYSLVQEMENDPKLPLINKFNATYSPGSTFKPITASVGLNEGSLTREETIDIDGLTWSNGEGWGDYAVKRVSESNGPVDLTDALVRSDNIYFAMKAIDMGAKTLISGLEAFGFGEDIPFDYPIQASTFSKDGTITDEVLLANTGYGQGEVQMSAIHLALTYTTFLNEGNMLKPTLLTEQDHSQIWKKDLLSPEEALSMQDDLRKVVEDGSGRKAQLDDIPIAGKTGTAELKLTADAEDAQENGWFVGYTADDQDFLIAMMIEHTEDRGGSSYTTEKVAQIIKDIK